MEIICQSILPNDFPRISIEPNFDTLVFDAIKISTFDFFKEIERTYFSVALRQIFIEHFYQSENIIFTDEFMSHHSNWLEVIFSIKMFSKEENFHKAAEFLSNSFLDQIVKNNLSYPWLLESVEKTMRRMYQNYDVEIYFDMWKAAKDAEKMKNILTQEISNSENIQKKRKM